MQDATDKTQILVKPPKENEPKRGRKLNRAERRLLMRNPKKFMNKYKLKVKK